MPSCPSISVIIPVYNVKEFLPACLESVAAQTFTDAQIIAVDDGSTDGSEAVLAQFARRYPSWQVITQPNQGVAAARQAGLKQACGETVCFVDADDILDARYLEELWRVYRQTGAQVVLAPMVHFPPQPTEKRADFFKAGCLRGAQRVRIFDDFSAAMALCGKLIDRRCLEGLSFPAGRTGDDILPSIALLAASDPVALAPQAVYQYRQRENSQSRAGAGRFEGLLNGFGQARRLLKKQHVYETFAPGFEYICRVCLTSFMEKYGLTEREEKLLSRAREELLADVSVFNGRSRRFRLRQHVFNGCLKYGISYAKLWRVLRWFYGSGAERLKRCNNQAKSRL